MGVNIAPASLNCSYTWANQTSGTTALLYSIKAVNGLVAWTAGATGVVRRTTDGGITWGNGNPNPGVITGDIYNIEALDANTAFVTTSPGATFIYKTTNGGTDWLVDSTYNATVSSVCFVDKDTGYIALSDTTSLLQKTIDGGNSYFTIIKDSSYIIFYCDIHFINSQTGYFVSSTVPDFDKDGVYKTADYGKTWDKIVDQYSIKSLYVIDSCSLYIS